MTRVSAVWTVCTADALTKRQYYLILIGLVIVAVNVGIIFILLKLLLL